MIPGQSQFSPLLLLEIGGYFIPWIDNLLDTVATPAAIIGGIFVTSASLEGELDPSAQWTLSNCRRQCFRSNSTWNCCHKSSFYWNYWRVSKSCNLFDRGRCFDIVYSNFTFLVAIIPIVIFFLIWKSIGYIKITKKESLLKNKRQNIDRLSFSVMYRLKSKSFSYHRFLKFNCHAHIYFASLFFAWAK